ncbi:MAG: hypothetical protein RLZZ383_633 [Pseudomonadota bacterium]|jgi:small subunit ribosomal protein S21
MSGLGYAPPAWTHTFRAASVPRRLVHLSPAACFYLLTCSLGPPPPFLGRQAPQEFTLILVTVRENEPFEKALRRFRRKVEREGIRKDIKKNSFYLKPGEKRRLKQRLAEKRRRKALRRAARRAAKGGSRPSLR